MLTLFHIVVKYKKWERRKKMKKQNDTEVITVRISAKVRYLLEIACRKKRKTLAKYIEDAIDSTFKDVKLKGNTSVNSDRDNLWEDESDEIDRFIYLADTYPDLLTDLETKILLILQNFKTENIKFYTKKSGDVYYWDADLIRNCWSEIQEFAQHLSEFTGFDEREEELKPKARIAKKELEKVMKKNREK